MPETAGHPGVRSLLAKFENNSQNNSSSPPSRGRSPVNSDTSGPGRPLSKVRASFVNVEKAIRSPSEASFTAAESEASQENNNPVPNVKRVTSWGGKSNGSIDDAKASQNRSGSSPPDNRFEPSQKAMEQIANVIAGPRDTSGVGAAQKFSAKGDAQPKTDNNAPSSKNTSFSSKPVDKPASNTTSSTASSRSSREPVQASKAPTKRPESKSRPAPSSKPVTGRRSPTSSSKSSNSDTSNTARSTKSTTAQPAGKESAKVPSQRPSRSTLNPATKTTARTARSSTPSRGTTRPATKSNPASPVTRTTRSKSPSQPTRRPVSMITPGLSSTTKNGSTSRSPTRTIASKPSTTSHARANAPTNASVRKQASRPSLANNPANDQPGSRTNNAGSKAPSEGFLARLTRPTASFASKTHEKVEAKSPPRPTKTVKPPTKTASKDPHGSHPLKEKATSEKKSQNENSKPINGIHSSVKKDSKAVPSQRKERMKAYEAHLESLNTNKKKPAEEPTSEKPGVSEVSKPRPEEAVEETNPSNVKGSTPKPTEKPSETSQNVELSAEKSAELPTEKPVQSTVENTTKLGESSAEKLVESAAEISNGSSAEKPAESSAEEQVEPAKSTAEVPVEASAEKSDELTAESQNERLANSAESPVETPANSFTEKSNETSAEKPPETSAEPATINVDSSANQPLDTSATAPAEVPAEQSAQTSTENVDSAAPEENVVGPSNAAVDEQPKNSIETPESTVPESANDTKESETSIEKPVDGNAATTTAPAVSATPNDADQR